jgi:hypothetical protein
MSSRVTYSRIRLEISELFDFLIEKMKAMFRLKGSDFSTGEGGEGVYVVEFKNPVGIPYKKFNEFTTFLLDLGFMPIGDKDEKLVHNDEIIFRSSIYEYMNDDRVRVVMVLDDEIGKDKHVVYLKKILVGKTSLINNPVSKEVEAVLRVLERMAIDYKHYVEPYSQVIEVSGHVVGARTSPVFVVEVGECKEIEIVGYKNPKKVRVYDICNRKHESVEIGNMARVDYENGSLYMRFFHG